MTRKKLIIEKIHETGMVAIIRTASSETACNVTGIMFEEGVVVQEITMTVPGGVQVLEEISRKYRKDGLILGAGSVLDPETARICILAGAEFIVTPSLNTEVIRLCNRYSIPCIPGIATPTEYVEAMELGVDVVKAFPGEVLGPGFIKALRGPFPEAKIIPTGGVNYTNLEPWFKAGAYAVGMGSGLTKPEDREGDQELIRETARKVLKRIREIRRGISSR